MDMGLLDYAARWILLSACFFFLVHLFGDSMRLEGFLGYLFPFLVVVPVNVLARVYSASWVHVTGMPQAESLQFIPAVGMLLILNFALLFVFHKLLPGLTIAGVPTLVLFCLIFAAIAFGLWLVPPLPPLPVFGSISPS